MADGIRIDQLDPGLGSLTHEIPAMKDGLSVKLTLAQIIAVLTNGAPEALDTWLELVAEIQENETGLSTLLSSVAALNTRLDTSEIAVTRQVFTASGTYTKPAGVKKIHVLCVGGGGGGGYARTAAAQSSGGSGGGAGGCSESLLAEEDVASTVAITIGPGGAGGIGGTPVNPTDGGDTSFGALVVAKGGKAGVNAASAASWAVDGGLGGAAAAGTGQLKQSGGVGGPSLGASATVHFAGNGGNSRLGAGGQGQRIGTGQPGELGGGGGGVSGSASEARNGGNGGNGICIVTEYY